MQLSFDKIAELDFDTIQAAPRSQRLHLFDIIRYIESMVAKARAPMVRADAQLHWEKGFIWEDVFSQAWARRYGKQRGEFLIAQSEVVRDGIAMTPDFIDVVEEAVVEAKATARSINKIAAFEQHFNPWLIQVKSYCRAVGVTKAYMPILFLCGDYKPPVPRALIARLSFSPQELDDNWAMVVRIARLMKERGHV